MPSFSGAVELKELMGPIQNHLSVGNSHGDQVNGDSIPPGVSALAHRQNIGQTKLLVLGLAK